MHTLREPLLRKQSEPARGDSVASSPDDRFANAGGRKQNPGNDRGKSRKVLVFGIAVIALAGAAVVARQNGYGIDIPFAAGAWHEFTSNHASLAPAAIKDRPVVAHSIINKGAIDHEQAVKTMTPPPVTMLPQWVQTAVKNDNADLAKARKADNELSSQITQITTRNQQLVTHEHQLQTTILNDQVRIDRLEARLHALARRPRPTTDIAQGIPQAAGKAGLVALQAPQKPGVTADDHRKPQRTAKGWLVVAVHGGKAVLQTPGGQVVMVRKGQTIGGKTVEGVNDMAQTVTLSGGLVAHLFGK